MWLPTLDSRFLRSHFKLWMDKYIILVLANHSLTQWMKLNAHKLHQKHHLLFGYAPFFTRLFQHSTDINFAVTRRCKKQHHCFTFRRHNSLRRVKALAGNEQSLPVTSVSEQMERDCAQRRQTFQRAIRRMSAVLFGWALQEVCPTALWTWRDRQRSDNLWGTVTERGRMDFTESHYSMLYHWHNRSVSV